MDYKRILTLHYTGGMSGREIAEATGVGKTTVNEFLKRFHRFFSSNSLKTVYYEILMICFKIIQIIRS